MASFRRYIHIYGFLVLLLIGLVLSKNIGGKKKRANNDEWNVKYYPTGRGPSEKRLDIHLACRKGYVLTDIDVLAGRDNNHCNETSIYGKTINLITAINNCEWKRTCTIQFSEGFMIQCEPSLDGSDMSIVNYDFRCNCLLENVEFMKPVKAKCVKESQVYTMCDGNKLPNKQGLIKSHKVLPWQYGASMKNQLCKISPDIKIGRNKRNKKNGATKKSREKKLVLSVKYVHLYDGDTLVLNVIDKANSAVLETYDLGNDTLGTTNIEILPEKNKVKTVQLQFKVLDDTQGGEGFIICYKEEKIKAKVTNVCDTLKRIKVPRLSVEHKLESNG